MQKLLTLGLFLFAFASLKLHANRLHSLAYLQQWEELEKAVLRIDENNRAQYLNEVDRTFSLLDAKDRTVLDLVSYSLPAFHPTYIFIRRQGARLLANQNEIFLDMSEYPAKDVKKVLTREESIGFINDKIREQLKLDYLKKYKQDFIKEPDRAIGALVHSKSDIIVYHNDDEKSDVFAIKDSSGYRVIVAFKDLKVAFAGSSEVFLGIELKTNGELLLDEIVAVKYLNSPKREDFINETDLYKGRKLPIQFNNNYYIIMPFEGIPLTDVPKNFPDEIKYEICLGMLHGLIEIQKNHILHLDLKPRNVLLSVVDERLVVKIIDFGEAAFMNRVDRRPYPSPAFAPPENDRRPRARWGTGADTYALSYLWMLVFGGANSEAFDFSDLVQPSIRTAYWYYYIGNSDHNEINETFSRYIQWLSHFDKEQRPSLDDLETMARNLERLLNIPAPEPERVHEETLKTSSKKKINVPSLGNAIRGMSNHILSRSSSPRLSPEPSPGTPKSCSPVKLSPSRNFTTTSNLRSSASVSPTTKKSDSKRKLSNSVPTTLSDRMPEMEPQKPETQITPPVEDLRDSGNSYIGRSTEKKRHKAVVTASESTAK